MSPGHHGFARVHGSVAGDDSSFVVEVHSGMSLGVDGGPLFSGVSSFDQAAFLMEVFVDSNVTLS